MASFKVLLVCDEPDGGCRWANALRHPGLEVVLTSSAEEALGLWEQETFDMVVIDVPNPQLDGLDLCRKLRAQAVNPILLLMPKGDESHILEAYRAGADECIIKPISPLVLLSKVRAWLRRSWTISAGALDSLQVGDLHLDSARCTVTTASGSSVRLTNLELRLLHLLMSHAGQALAPEAIFDRVWGPAGGGDRRLLERLVERVRHKIEPDPTQPRYLRTMADEGYVFRSN